MPKGAEFVAGAPEIVQAALADATDLHTFLKGAGKLSPAARQLLVDQALVLLEQFYVHLPLKRAMHAVDPVQRLRLLRYRLEQTPAENLPKEIDFHNEMTEIFTSVRDLHTNYLLPTPYAETTAFLPFLIEEFFEDNQRKYLLSKAAAGFQHATFLPGVEVLYWNGTPIERAVDLNAQRQAGSNLDARRARGLDALTVRPMLRTAPPDEEWVVIGYRTPQGEELEFRQPWLVFSPELGSEPGGADDRAAAQGIDLQTDAVNQVKKVLYAPQALEAEKRIAEAEVRRAAPAQGVDTTMPTVFRARDVVAGHGAFAYVRIFTFSVPDADAFVAEFVRLIAGLPQNGLILDVRGNGGGLIYAAERLLQVLTPRRIQPERAQFINTPLVLELCRRNTPSTSTSGVDLSPWIESVAQAVETGAAYSSAYPITPEDTCNTVGQRYYGPVLLITDALCYSATDIFAAGFQDHAIGPILGVSGNTGAGGANVWTHDLLRALMPGRGTPLKPLPNGAGMRVSIRRTLRVGERAGLPVEDLGVAPDHRHFMTRNDLISSNFDLIDAAAALLAQRPAYQFDIAAKKQSASTLKVTATTANITRLDVFLDSRPQRSVDVAGRSRINFTLALPRTASSELELQGFAGEQLVAARRVRV